MSFKTSQSSCSYSQYICSPILSAPRVSDKVDKKHAFSEQRGRPSLAGSDVIAPKYMQEDRAVLYKAQKSQSEAQCSKGSKHSDSDGYFSLRSGTLGWQSRWTGGSAV